MRLILCRHGEALPGPVDRDRELSPGGRVAIERAGEFLANAGVRVDRVAHSGLVRARQTAELLAAAIAPGCRPERMDGLFPEDPIDEVAHEARSLTGNTLLVGHLPHLAKLASRLLVGDERALGVRLRAGTVLALDGEEGDFQLAWMIPPELL